MQLIHSNNTISTNVANKVEFGISKNSTKIFAMLSSSLYSNKEVAVLYEIGANCNDAHKLNGNEDIPWTLVSPTILDPNIKFRDYGPGLSEDQVYTLLTTYGESTKDNSNEFIGAYGIGAKSPAAVTSSWTVISRFDGTMTEYLVYIDSSGIPSLSKLRTEETNETGLEVIIPVPINAFSRWVNNYSSVFSEYKVRPIIKNVSVFYNTHDVISKGINWSIYNTPIYSSLYAVTTQRKYDLDADLIKTEFKGEKFLSLFNINVGIYFPVGSLETSLSRESIQYTKHTLFNIKSTFSNVYNDISGRIKEILNDATDGLHYRQKVFEVCNKFFGTSSNIQPSSILNFIINSDDITAKKYGINSDRDIDYHTETVLDYKNKNIRVFTGKTISKLNNNLTCDKTWAITRDIISGDIDCAVKFKIKTIDRLVIVIADCKFTASKVKHNFPNKFVYISSDIAFEPCMSRFIVRASTLAKPPTKPSLPRQYPKQEYKIWKLNKTAFSINYSPYMVGDMIYSEFNDRLNSNSVSILDRKLIPIATKMGFNINYIKAGDKIPPNAIAIKDFAKKFVDDNNNLDFIDQFYYTEFFNKLNSSNSILYRLYTSNIKPDKKSVWVDIKTELTSIKNVDMITPKKYQNLLDFAYILEISVCTSKNKKKSLAEYTDLVYTTYPMLACMQYPMQCTDATLQQYINQVGE